MTGTVVLVILALFAAILFAVAILNTKTDANLAEGLEESWTQAMSREDSQVGRLLLSVSKPLGGLKQTHLTKESSLYRLLQRKLWAAGGGFYANSVEIFVSVQLMTLLLSAVVLVAAVALGGHGALLVALLIVSLAFAAMPYNRISTQGKKRRLEVTQGLPEFAELLLMPVTSGYSIIPALDFTATRLTGVVSDEVKTMLALLSSRSASESQAFRGTGERLGEPAAITFFQTLYDAYVDGVKIADTLRSQAEQLRKQEYERKREQLKKLPNTMALIIGLHLMPFLFALTLVPTFYALSSI